ncbi:MAG: TolC family protein, partial [Blastocatellia bacterium]|nr:TolC family protein [Blastocatellia bacterium]
MLFSLLLFRAEVFSQTQAVSSETGTVRIPELKVYTPKIRAGITPGKTLFLSLQDAIGRVLEHNLDIQMEKNNIRSKEASLLAAKGLFDFSFGSQFGYLRSNTPTVSALQGDPRSLFT